MEKHYTQEVLTDEEIDVAWGNANFGSDNKRAIIANALLKYSCGYQTGRTIEVICAELGLIGITRNLTKKGKSFMYEFYKNNLSV